jgi:hypothetical protein
LPKNVYVNVNLHLADALGNPAISTRGMKENTPGNNGAKYHPISCLVSCYCINKKSKLKSLLFFIIESG